MITDNELIARLSREKYDLQDSRDFWMELSKSYEEQIKECRKEIDRLRNSKHEDCDCDAGGASNE